MWSRHCWTDCLKIFNDNNLTWWEKPLTQNGYKFVHGGLLDKWLKYNFLWYVSRETPQVRPLDGFWGLMPQKLRNHARMFLWVSEYFNSNIWPYLPHPSRKRQNLAQNRQSEATVSKRESPNISEITESTTWKSACILSIQAETFHFILDRIQPGLASHRLVLSTSNVVQHATRSYPFYALNTSRLSYSASIRPS